MIVQWTESALADLHAIEAYIAGRSPRYARSMVERIFERSDLLATQPRLGPILPEFQDDSIREVFENPFRIIYRICDSHIDVIAVVHAARRLPDGF